MRRGIFCNRTLNLRAIRAIGYDMDYTLIHYRAEEWELRAYEYLKAHFGARGIPVEIIQLSGSIELAPALGLADMIVDLVQTGVTLRENGLTIVEEIAESTGRLVVNRASYQLKSDEVGRLVDALEFVV